MANATDAETESKRRYERAVRKAPRTHYVSEFECGNCLKDIMITIPKGTFVEDFVKNINCPNCGCPLQDPELSALMNKYLGDTDAE
jgi:rubrerythrin